MAIELRHFRYFIAVAEERHFRRAAEKIGIAQPALSRAIRDLEIALDVTLFDRSNRNVDLTGAGHVLLDRSRRVLNSVDCAIDDVRCFSQGRSRSLRIGYTDAAMSANLPSLLRDFQEEQSEITFEMHRDVTVLQVEKLKNHALDIGFLTGPVGWDGCEQIPIASEPFVCIVSRKHRFADRGYVWLKDLAGEDFVLGSQRHWAYFYSYIIPLCRRGGFSPNIVCEETTTTKILGLVACGLGITLLTESIRNALSPDLIALPIKDAVEELQTVAVWRPDAMAAPKDAFIHYLKHAAPIEKFTA